MPLLRRPLTKLLLWWRQPKRKPQMHAKQPQRLLRLPAEPTLSQKLPSHTSSLLTDLRGRRHRRRSHHPLILVQPGGEGGVSNPL